MYNSIQKKTNWKIKSYVSVLVKFARFSEKLQENVVF